MWCVNKFAYLLHYFQDSSDEEDYDPNQDEASDDYDDDISDDGLAGPSTRKRPKLDPNSDSSGSD